jgi:hypothetical protein
MIDVRVRALRAQLGLLFLVAAGLIAAGASACGGGTTTTTTTVQQPIAPTPTPTPTPPPAPNNVPRVTLASSSPRVQMEREITLTANVTDDETPAAQMTYEWSAPTGAFTGTGSSVRWRAGREDRTPVTHTITVKVIEKHAGGQHEVTATVAVVVNNSQKELSDLAGGFIADFSNSTLSAEWVTRNFHDSCRGKREELEDVSANRARYTITGSQWNVTDVTFNYDAGTGLVTIRARFTSIIKATGATEIAVGDALISGIYVGDRWYLCESRWRPVNAFGAQFLPAD